jgi:formamidopyrimidine-DNA glycosylase
MYYVNSSKIHATEIVKFDELHCNRLCINRFLNKITIVHHRAKHMLMKLMKINLLIISHLYVYF